MTGAMKTEGLGVARLHFPIRSLGFGERIGLWVQGCSLHCAGCMSRDTWAPARTRLPVQALADEIDAWLPRADGLSITGGEPMEQAGALTELLEILRPRLRGDVIVFTGYDADALPEGAPRLLSLIDTLVAGPFEAAQPSAVPLLGSANQTLRFQSELGRERYERFCLEARARAPMDLILEDDGVWMAGIPRPGDLERLGRNMEARGLSLTTSAGRMGDRR